MKTYTISLTEAELTLLRMTLWVTGRREEFRLCQGGLVDLNANLGKQADQTDQAALAAKSPSPEKEQDYIITTGPFPSLTKECAETLRNLFRPASPDPWTSTLTDPAPKGT